MAIGVISRGGYTDNDSIKGVQKKLPCKNPNGHSEGVSEKLTQIKDQLTSLSPQGGGVPGGDKLKQGSDTLKEMVPKF